jgi:hypothetical protein
VRPIGDWSMSMILSRMLEPSMRSCGRRMLARAVQPARRRLVERVDDQRRFAAAGDAGDAGEGAERESAVTFFRLLPRAPTIFSQRSLLGRRRRGGGTATARSPDRYWPVSDFGLAMISPACPRRRLAAVMPAPGPMSTRGRRRGSRPRRARPRSPCCRGRAAAAACRAGARCRAGAGRSRARRAHRARRSGPSRSARRGGCAGSRRPTACPSRAPASDNRGRHRPGTQPVVDFLQDAPAISLRLA